ncbi:MAG: AsmA-like C-terminal region-containing protein [Verrucomicrobiia bacterium]
MKIADGVFQFWDSKQKAKVRCEGIQANGDFLTAPNELQSQGSLKIQTIVIDPNIELTHFKSPIIYTNEVLLLPNFQSDLYKGKLSGRFRARFDKEQKPFRSKINVTDFDLKNFIETRSDKKSPIEGKGNLNFEGQGAFEDAKNIAGKGDFLVKSFRAEGLKFFREIGSIIGVPGLADITFDEVIGNFYIKNQQVVIEKVETRPKNNTTFMEGRGTIDFEGNLNFSGSVTLNSGLIGGLGQLLNKVKIKSKEGTLTIPFKVTGTTENPKVQVISFDGAGEAVKGLLDLIPDIKF